MMGLCDSWQQYIVQRTTLPVAPDLPCSCCRPCAAHVVRCMSTVTQHVCHMYCLSAWLQPVPENFTTYFTPAMVISFLSLRLVGAGPISFAGSQSGR
jgi:hypothetical protein